MFSRVLMTASLNRLILKVVSIPIYDIGSNEAI